MNIIQIGKFGNKTFKFGDMLKIDLQCDCCLVGFFNGFERSIFGKQNLRMLHYTGKIHNDIITYVRLHNIKDVNILELRK